MDWQPIDDCEPMLCVWLHHPYYSHGQVRHGFMAQDGNWRGVNADGTEGVLRFRPTHFALIAKPQDTDR
jgi:hypothetical protein